MCCDPHLKRQWDSSDEESQHTVLLRNKKNYPELSSNTHSYLELCVISGFPFRQHQYQIIEDHKVYGHCYRKVKPYSKYIALSIMIDAWMTCDFTSFSIIFQSYYDDSRPITKSCVQWSSMIEKIPASRGNQTLDCKISRPVLTVFIWLQDCIFLSIE